jgi:multidrug efflux pump subunit AcrB
VNWSNGVNYNVGIQTPQYKVNTLDALLRTPISTAVNGLGSGTANANAAIGTTPNGASQAYGNPGAMPGNSQLLSNLVTVKRGYTPVIVNHYNVMPVFDVYANVARRDLGGVGAEVENLLKEESKHMPRGVTLELRGQITTMRSSFLRLGLGMIFAVVLVYLLMTVNFQSWVDPFIILSALPGAMAGILWMLFVTRTTLSVPSLMGAIMCVGVATANSILMVTFANDQRASIPGVAGLTAREAMLAAGDARIRPVLMTATAMVLGMLPMALGLGEGGEQNAPLGRAVIGGLAVATITTLFVVPIIYSYLRVKPPVDYESKLAEAEA